MRAGLAAGLLLAAGWGWVGRAGAHEPEPEVSLPDVAVTAKHPTTAASEMVVTERDLLAQPQGHTGLMLQVVPGMIALNPSGSAGKADQYLLRGFDADHGTDIAFFFDGLPINIRSHAHGQGYTDLNFIIPETLTGIEAYKGPYQVQFGDFATAGAMKFVTRDVVQEGVVQAVGGQFDTQRYVTMFSPTRDRVRSLVATEAYFTNGPFTNPNRYFRFNALVKAVGNPTTRSELSVTGTFNQGQWNQSGEIPVAAVQAGLLNRFGAVDPSQGGRTQRATGLLRYHYDTTSGGTAFAEVWAQRYRLDLFSNFTYFLFDPVHGDGIQQKDDRWIYGSDAGWRQRGTLWGSPVSATAGVQTRVDRARVLLGTEQTRAPLATTSNSEIVEASYSPYVQVEAQPASWMRVNGGARTDVFTFDVTNLCATCPQRPSGRADAVVPTVKGNLVLGPWFGTELFVNAGSGFHSNDARGVVGSQGVPAVARATAYETGLRTKPWDRVELIATLWTLNLSSELVFDGDTGTTEALGATRRYGTELGLRLKLLDWLRASGDLTFARATFRNSGQPVPLAPRTTGRAELTADLPQGILASLQAVYLGRRPLDETGGVMSQPFTILNFVLRYRLPVPVPYGKPEAFFSAQNLLNADWRQEQLFYTSRLQGQPPEGVPGVHFVPGIPRMVMGGLAWYF